MVESGGSLRPLTLSRVLFCRSGVWLLLRKQPRLSVAVSVTGLDFWAQFCLHSFIYNLILPSLPTLCHRLPPSGVWSIVPPLLLPQLTLPSSPPPPPPPPHFFFFWVWVGGSVALLVHPSVLSWPCLPLLHEVYPFLCPSSLIYIPGDHYPLSYSSFCNPLPATTLLLSSVNYC